jgi:hypothetical protein
VVKIKRTYLDNATKGDGSVIVNGAVIFSFKTLELPWKNNEKMVSCIPAGKYTCVKRNSKKYGVHFHVTNVPDRDMILIHHGNYTSEILGCILPGLGHIDINKDGIIDVTSSIAAMNKLRSILPNKFELEII